MSKANVYNYSYTRHFLSGFKVWLNNDPIIVAALITLLSCVVIGYTVGVILPPCPLNMFC
jgi:hypothetical protein